MKIAYFGYDFFHETLRHILDNGIDVVKIFTFETDNIYNFNIFMHAIAAENGIPIQTAKPTRDDMLTLIDRGVTVFLSCGYLHKIPVIERDGIYSVNLHPALLPDVRGIWPLPYILLKHRNAAGLTYHKHAQDWDTGDILFQRPLALSAEDDLESYSARCMMAAPSETLHVLRNVETLYLNAVPQSQYGAGSYYSMPDDTMRTWIFAHMTCAEIDAIGRAFGRFEVIFHMDGKKHWAKDYCVWIEAHDYAPGTLSSRINRELVFATRDGFCCIKDYYKAKEDN